MISFTDIAKLGNIFKSEKTNTEKVDQNFMTSMKQYYGSIKKGVDEFNCKYIHSSIQNKKQIKIKRGERKSFHGFNNVYNRELKKSFSSIGGVDDTLLTKIS